MGVCGIRQSRLFRSQVLAAQPRPQQPPQRTRVVTVHVMFRV